MSPANDHGAIWHPGNRNIIHTKNINRYTCRFRYIRRNVDVNTEYVCLDKGEELCRCRYIRRCRWHYRFKTNTNICQYIDVNVYVDVDFKSNEDSYLDVQENKKCKFIFVFIYKCTNFEVDEGVG